VTRYLTGLRSVTTSLLSGLIIFVIGPVMAFYLLVDLPRLERGAMAWSRRTAARRSGA
jgi:predicted PurR-regulated permease PerM